MPISLENESLNRLEMHHSYIDTPASDSLKELRTSGHNGNRMNRRDFYDGVYGDKGVYSTVEDMAKWYYALKNNCLLNKYWLKQAFTPRNLEKKSRHNYGPVSYTHLTLPTKR